MILGTVMRGREGDRDAALRRASADDMNRRSTSLDYLAVRETDSVASRLEARRERQRYRSSKSRTTSIKAERRPPLRRRSSLLVMDGEKLKVVKRRQVVRMYQNVNIVRRLKPIIAEPSVLAVDVDKRRVVTELEVGHATCLATRGDCTREVAPGEAIAARWHL